MRIPIRALLVSALLSGAFIGVQAQQPVPLRPPDSLRTDSLRADSLRRRGDTLSATDRLLQVQGQKLVHLNPLPLCGANTLQPAGGRMVFDRDSIDWAAAESVGELLARVPGVFTQRSDWLGSPESPVYFGLGAASVEYLQDCVPMAPIGPDSVAINPAIIPLGFLERIEVERSPGIIRVFLFTLRHDRQAPRTKIGASQGDRGATRYFGSYERRYTSGIGLSLGADYVGLNAQGNGSGGGNIPSAWIQLGYVPSARIGIQAQLITHLITQNTLVGEDKADTLLQSVNGTRTDEQLRGSWRQRPDGIGNSIDLILAHTSWSSDTAPGRQGLAQFGLIVGRREPTWSAQWATWHYSRITALDSRLDLGWAPFDRVSGSVQVVAQQHDNHRTSDWATGRIGIKLPLGFNVGGMVSDGRRVQTPAVIDDVAQQFKDAEVTAGFASRLLTVDAGYTRNDGWRPRAFEEFVAVAGLAPLPQVNWLTMHARLAPLGWLTFETLYQNPLAGALVDGTPPSHFLSTATLRSRFLRNFPSGIFALKLQVSLENWGAGIGGRDSLGTAIPLPAATFFRAIIQFQIGPFIAYYDKINLKADRGGYVPGYVVQPVGSTFGIRWEFSN